jgi:hypothetical protein
MRRDERAVNCAFSFAANEADQDLFLRTGASLLNICRRCGISASRACDEPPSLHELQRTSRLA